MSRRRITKQLRTLMDGNDNFIGGHQVIQINRPRKQIPTWVSDDDHIRLFLLRSFPRMKFDLAQRERAARWMRVIHLYFRQLWTRGQIADEIGATYSSVNSMIRHIRRAAKGMRTGGTGSLGGKRGRPKVRKEANVNCL